VSDGAFHFPTSEQVIMAESDRLKSFLIRLGSEARQGAVGFVIDRDYMEIQFDADGKPRVPNPLTRVTTGANMATNKLIIVNALGASVIGRIPEAGPGAFGAMRLPRLIAELRERLQPGSGERPGRPTESEWDRRPKIPMSEATAAKLQKLAERASTPSRKVSPMQMAAHLLEKAVAAVPDE
jgi:hypothetical protein